jgi:hypothetical protein
MSCWLSCLRARIHPCHKVSVRSGALAPEVHFSSAPKPFHKSHSRCLGFPSKRAGSGQHGGSSAGLRSDWRGLPIICRSCAQTRSRPAPSQVNFRCTPYPPRYTPYQFLPSSVFARYSGAASEAVILAQPESPYLFWPLLVLAVILSASFEREGPPMNSASPQPPEPFSHKTPSRASLL